MATWRRWRAALESWTPQHTHTRWLWLQVGEWEFHALQSFSRDVQECTNLPKHVGSRYAERPEQVKQGAGNA